MDADSRQIDEGAALDALSGDRQLLCQLAEIFVEDAPIILKDLDSAVATNNLELARRLVHSLKGLSSTFFAKSSTQLASRLEAELQRGSAESLHNGGPEQLKHSIESLIQELRNAGYVN